MLKNKPGYFRIFLKDDYTDEIHRTYLVNQINYKTFTSMYLDKAVIMSTSSKKYVKSFNLETKRIVFTDNIHVAMLFKDFTYARKMMVQIYKHLDSYSENCINKNLGRSYEEKKLVSCIFLK